MFTRLFSALCTAATLGVSLANEPVMVPTIEGDWWQVAGQPDLGPLNSPRQQPVDFAIWQARDGTWQLWSCIRYTSDPKNTRVLFRWEGRELTQRDWTPMGIAQKADPSVGEFEGRIGAPHVIEEDGRYVMFYHSAGFHAQVSDDGKHFTRQLAPDGSARIFGPDSGTYGRDIMLTRIQDKWHGYYGGSTPDPTGKHYAAVFVKVAETGSLFGAWSREFIVNSEGQAGSGGYNAECPQVIFRHGWYYLFRTEVYGANNRTHIYRSKSPYKFGIDSDAYHVGTLPIAAPEIFEYEGHDYVAALNPGLDGIRVARLGWVEATPDANKPTAATATESASRPMKPSLAPETLLLATNPELPAELGSPNAEIAEHTLFADAHGTWHLWASIRNTARGDMLGHWESKDFFSDSAWRWTGEIAGNDGSAAAGERTSFRSPIVAQHDGRWWRLHSEPAGGNDTTDRRIVASVSADGRAWSPYRNADGQSQVFAGPGAARDPFLVRFGDTWHCYYTGHYGGDEKNSAVYVRTSLDLLEWSAPKIAHEDYEPAGGRRADTHESPIVVHRAGWYYLFRTAAGDGTYVYRSRDPLDFGRGYMINKFIAKLPLTSPELVVGPDGRDYVTSSRDETGARIRMYRLIWENSEAAQ